MEKTASRLYKKAIEEAYKELNKHITKDNVIGLYSLCEYMLNDYKHYKKEVFKATKKVKECISKLDPRGEDKRLQNVFWQTMKLEARNGSVDSGLLYLERYRDDDKKFYLPRRDIFIKFGIIDGLQKLVDGDIELLTISMPPRTGKSTCEIFFFSLLIGWDPNKSILLASYSDEIVKNFYDSVYRILTDKHEYAWQELFPEWKLESQNAKSREINVDRPKMYKSFIARSIDGTITGAVEATQLLACDDLIKNQEEALNKSYLEKLWSDKYGVVLKQRKVVGTKELHIATRWSVNDVIGKLERQYEGNERGLFIKVPALNSAGESNFQYDGDIGFTTEYYKNLENTMDKISFNCIYQQEAVERDGLLFEDEKLRKYYKLPDEECDGVWAVCDTKDKGTDFVSMPIAYQYGDDFYIEDVVFTDSTNYDLVDNELAKKLDKHNVGRCRFESNNAGGRVASDVQKILNDRKSKVSIETKYTRINKETKILVNSDFIIKHCLFKETEEREYKNFYNNLITYTAKGKNLHDDAPDSMAMLSEFVGRGRVAEARIINSPI